MTWQFFLYGFIQWSLGWLIGRMQLRRSFEKSLDRAVPLAIQSWYANQAKYNTTGTPANSRRIER